MPAREHVNVLAKLVGRLPGPVLAVILCATLIRFALAFQGQYLFPDESRYDRALDFWEATANLEPARAVTGLFKAKARPGAIVLYLPVALVQWVVMKAGGLTHIETSWIPSLFTALIALLNAILFWHLSLRVTASTAASTVATLIYSLCAPSLYYSQFLLPYVAAQTLFIGSLLCLPGKHQREQGSRRFLLSGFLFGLTLATYPGYYDQSFVFGVLALAFWSTFSLRDLPKMVLAPLGTVAVLACFELLSWLGWGPTYIESLVALKTTMSSSAGFGEHSEIWCYPAIFLWNSDCVLSVLLLSGLTFAIVACLKLSQPARAPRYLLAGVAIWYTSKLIEAATESQLLFGRLVFQILPSLCLLSGFGWLFVFGQTIRRRHVLAGASVVLCSWACWNISPFFRATIPSRFQQEHVDSNPDYWVSAYVTSAVGTSMMNESYQELDKRLIRMRNSKPDATTPVVLVNVPVMQPASGILKPEIPSEQILAAGWHPYNIPAVLFDISYGPEARAAIRGYQLQVILLKSPPQHLLPEWCERWGGHKYIPTFAVVADSDQRHAARITKVR